MRFGVRVFMAGFAIGDVVEYPMERALGQYRTLFLRMAGISIAAAAPALGLLDLVASRVFRMIWDFVVLDSRGSAIGPLRLLASFPVR